MENGKGNHIVSQVHVWHVAVKLQFYSMHYINKSLVQN